MNTAGRISRRSLLASSRLHQGAQWCWRTAPSGDDLWERFEQVPWRGLDEQASAARLKENDLRSVWRLALDDVAVIAKVFPPAQGWQRLKQRCLGSSAQREFVNALYGERHGLPTVRALAWGRGGDGPQAGTEVLITREIAGARPLSACWLSQVHGAQPHCRQTANRLIAAVARLLAELHHHGFVPADLHPENILVTPENSVVLVDLHNATIGINPTMGARHANLADLNQWFQRHASGTDRLRFLLAYLTYVFAEANPRLVRRMVPQVQELTAFKAQRLAHKRDKRIFGDNKYFGIVSLPHDWTAHVYLQAKRPIAGSPCSRLCFDRADWQAALAQFSAAPPDPPPAQLQVGAHQLPVTIEHTRHGANGLRQRWAQAHRQINRHQATALPLALLEHTVSGGTTETILISERSAPA